METKMIALAMLLRNYQHMVEDKDPIVVWFYEPVPPDWLAELRRENPEIIFKEHGEAG